VLAQRDELREADAGHRRAQAAIHDALQPASSDRNTWPAEIRDLRTQQPSAELWRSAVDQMLITIMQTASDDPRESINRLIDWHVSVAMDPLVSSDARALVQRGRDDYLRNFNEQPSAEPYPLPDDLYVGSKDWLASDYPGRVEWLHHMYEHTKRDRDEILAQMASVNMGELVQAARDALAYMDSVGQADMHPEEWAVADALRRALDKHEAKGGGR
jgi:hypothetical protein